MNVFGGNTAARRARPADTPTPSGGPGNWAGPTRTLTSGAWLVSGENPAGRTPATERNCGVTGPRRLTCVDSRAPPGQRPGHGRPRGEPAAIGMSAFDQPGAGGRSSDGCRWSFDSSREASGSGTPGGRQEDPPWFRSASARGPTPLALPAELTASVAIAHSAFPLQAPRRAGLTVEGWPCGGERMEGVQSGSDPVAADSFARAPYIIRCTFRPRRHYKYSPLRKDR